MSAHILNDFIVVNCVSSEIDPKTECVHFLTHIGRDQTTLSNIISSHIKKVYTSEFNVWYLKTFFSVNVGQFISVPLWTKKNVKSKGSTFSFEFLNANHCPGAVMILIKGNFGNYLYTGNCRFSPAMLDYTSLKPFAQGLKTLDKLYVNAPYLKIEFNFPKREVVVQQIIDFISEHSEENIYICTRLLGKEDILFRIALESKEKIFVSENKLKILNKLGYRSNAFTTVHCEARLRIVDVNEMTRIKMKRRRLTEKCVGIIFSGCHGNSERLKEQGIYIYPASDHSSCHETKLMIKSLSARDIFLLNGDSTLGEYIKYQQIRQLHNNFSSIVINSPVEKKVEENHNGKKKLSLKLNSRSDKNQLPIVTVEKGSSKNIACNILKSNNVYKKGSVKGKKVIEKSVEDDGGEDIVMTNSFVNKDLEAENENSFVIDETAAPSGFICSHSQSDNNQYTNLSPSFPPSLSNIVLNETCTNNDLSMKHYLENQSFTSSDPQVDRNSFQKELETPKNIEAVPDMDRPLMSSHGSYASHNMSASYPLSFSKILLTKASETNNIIKNTGTEVFKKQNNLSDTYKTCNNSFENIEITNPVKENDLFKSNIFKETRLCDIQDASSVNRLNSSTELTSQLHLLSPSFPPSVTSFVLKRFSENDHKSQPIFKNQETKSHVDSYETVSRHSCDSNNGKNIYSKNSSNLFSHKSYKKSLNSGKSFSHILHKVGSLYSEKINDILEVDDNVLITNAQVSSSRTRVCQPFEPEVVSKAYLTRSNNDQNLSLIRSTITLHDQTSRNCELMSMVQTRIDDSEEENIDNHPKTRCCLHNNTTLELSIDNVTSLLEEKLTCEKQDKIINNKTKCEQSVTSVTLSTLERNKITSVENIFCIDNLNLSEIDVDESCMSSHSRLTTFMSSCDNCSKSVISINKLNGIIELAHSFMNEFPLIKNCLFLSDPTNKEIRIVRAVGYSNSSIWEQDKLELIPHSGIRDQSRLIMNGKDDHSDKGHEKALKKIEKIRSNDVINDLSFQLIDESLIESTKSQSKLLHIHEQSALSKGDLKLKPTAIDKMVYAQVHYEPNNIGCQGTNISESLTILPSTFSHKTNNSGDLINAISDDVSNKMKINKSKKKTSDKSKTSSEVEQNESLESNVADGKLASLPLLRTSFKTCYKKFKNKSSSQPLFPTPSTNLTKLPHLLNSESINMDEKMLIKLNRNASTKSLFNDISNMESSTSDKINAPIYKRKNIFSTCNDNLFSNENSKNNSKSNLSLNKSKIKSRLPSQGDIFSSSQNVSRGSSSEILNPTLSLKPPILFHGYTYKMETSLPSNPPSSHRASLNKKLNHILSPQHHSN